MFFFLHKVGSYSYSYGAELGHPVAIFTSESVLDYNWPFSRIQYKVKNSEICLCSWQTGKNLLVTAACIMW